MKYYAYSDKGKKRKINQDSYGSYLADNGMGFFIVADGMGGHNAGEVASSIAVNSFIDCARRFSNDSQFEDIKEFIDYTFKRINDVILYKAAMPEMNGMGSTVVAAVVSEKQLVVGNLGDSRAYIIGSDGMRQITYDHTYVNLLLTAGKIGAEEAKHHSKQNEITKAVGIKNYFAPDIFLCEYKEGDRLILCSDGLDKMVDDVKIQKIAKDGDDPERICSALVEEANSNGGYDNITVITVIL